MKKYFLLTICFFALVISANAAIIGSNMEVVNESNANLSSGTGITLTTGHAEIAEISYNAAQIESNIGTDTALVSITGGPGRAVIRAHSGTNDFLFMTIASDETASDALQLEVEIDGTNILDMTNTSNNTDNITNYWKPTVCASNGTDEYSCIYEFNTSFKILGTKTGTIDGSSVFRMGPVYYELYE